MYIIHIILYKYECNYLFQKIFYMGENIFFGNNYLI